jgi:pilus assembly protein CpaC
MHSRLLLHCLAQLHLLLLLTALLPTFSHAQETGLKKLHLRVGGSELVRTDAPFKRVSIADPEVADLTVLSPREIYVYGKRVGYTSIILWEDGQSKTLAGVMVTFDLNPLKEKLAEIYPNEDIRIYASDRGVVLSGTVSGPEVAEQAVRLAQTFFPSEAGKETPAGIASAQGGTGRSGPGIVNLLRVGGPQQVMLEVQVAEVVRSWDREFKAALGLENLGKDFTGAFGTESVINPVTLTDSPVNINFPTTNWAELNPVTGAITNNNNFSTVLFNGNIDGLIQNPGSLLLNFAGNAANIFLEIDNFKTAFRFLENHGMARTLAEPRLVAISGQEANFHAGGEFPVPVPGEDGEVTIEYKKFGVSLRFTPVVYENGRVSLRVAPTVSEVASVSPIPVGIQGFIFNVPNLSSRSLETTVDLYDGQTLALAGLLQDNLRESIDKVPGLGDIPILGALFRSSQFRQEKTDLMIAVTPHMVKAVKEGTLKFPGEHMTVPNDYEFYLEGRLEGKRPFDEASVFGRHRFQDGSAPAPKKSGLEGDFGFQPVKE